MSGKPERCPYGNLDTHIEDGVVVHSPCAQCERDQLQSRVADLVRPMPCGHPVGAVVSADEGTSYCGWCADVARIELRAERLERLAKELAGDFQIDIEAALKEMALRGE